MAAFSPSQAISYGWTNAKQNWKWWIPVTLLYLFINAFPSFFQPAEGQTDSGLFGIIKFICSIIQVWLVTGITINAWNMIGGQAPSYKTLFPSIGLVVRYLLSSFASAVIGVVVGFGIIGISSAVFLTLPTSMRNPVVFIIAGLIVLALIVLIFWLSIRFSYAPYVAIFERKWPIAAIKRSWSITKGNIGTLIWLGILCLGVVIIGALALLVGLLWAFPTVIVANLYLYKQLSEAKS